MIEKIIIPLAKTNFCRKFNYNKFLEDIPNDYFLDNFSIKRSAINGSIILFSFILATIISCGVLFYNIVFSLLIFVIVILAIVLFLIRKIRKMYFEKILEVEQNSDLICREILLILSTTNSLSMVIEYLAQGSYPIISPMITQLIQRMNVGDSPISLLKTFALKQPSETIKEFILEIIIPIAKGQLTIDKTNNFEAQWLIRKNFDSYMSQLEGKMSLFLAITTIIPVTVSMLLVIMGYVNVSMLVFLPLVFLVFDLIAVEIFNSGKVELLGG
ncbi:MAG: hypothetical protein KGD59_08990 [Candidatus Heimdallarchaeota archaeon]|nr:hypothetical protein [Candidatus Heimdallarchaeota archaeon]